MGSLQRLEHMEKEYLKGYKEGFESALKMAWAYAEELKISVPNDAKGDVERFIQRLTH